MTPLAPKLLKLLGGLLIVAVFFKAYGLALDPVRPTGWLAHPGAQLAVLLVEVLLGSWFLLGTHEATAWLVAMLLFAVFAVVSLGQGWIGETSCGCFGRIRVSPWTALTLDVAVLSCLSWARPQTLRLEQLKIEISSLVKPVLVGGGAVVIILGVLASIAWYGFGSIDEGIAHLRGEGISAYPRLVDFGSSQPGQMHEKQVTLKNWTVQSIRIVGATDNCSCVATHDLPLSIPAGEARKIKLTLRAPHSPGAFTLKAFVLTNDGEYGRIPIRLTGVVMEVADERRGD
jgi:hypothetical protein